jgi:tetratricopeptide (TPR) repeat protein
MPTANHERESENRATSPIGVRLPSMRGTVARQFASVPGLILIACALSTCSHATLAPSRGPKELLLSIKAQSPAATRESVDAGGALAAPAPSTPDQTVAEAKAAAARSLREHQLFENIDPHGPWDWRFDAVQRYLDQDTAAGNQEDIANDLVLLGNLYRYSTRFDLALATHQKACNLGMDSVPCWQSLAADHVAAGKHADALELLQRALPVNERLTASEDEKERAWAQSRQPLLQRGLAIVLLGLGRSEEAEKILRELVAQSPQKGSDIRGWPAESDYLVDARRLLVRALVQCGQIEAALEEADRARDATLRHALASMQSSTAIGVAAGPRQAVERASMFKAFAHAQQVTLVEYSIDYNDDLGFLSSHTPNSIYSLGHHDLLRMTHVNAWVVSPSGGVHHVRTPVPTELSVLPDVLRALFRDWGVRSLPLEQRGARGLTVTEKHPAPEPSDAIPSRLYDLLLAPIADWLPKEPNARVVIIPQDDLFYVPFTALPSPSGRVLWDQYSVSLATSLEGLQLLAHSQPAARCDKASGALIVGNPAMPKVRRPDGSELTPPALPGAETEALAVARLLRAHALLGNAATKDAVLDRIENAKLLHFATHGFVNDEDPLFSALAVAPTATDEGLLSVREMQSLELCAQVAVLSACGTGAGRVSSDGLSSLASTLLGVGTQSVLMALWSLDDESTVELMRGFYLAIASGANTIDALRRAALGVQRNHPHPRQWAAMNLIGLPIGSAQLQHLKGDAQRVAKQRSALDTLPIPQNAYGLQRSQTSPDRILFHLPAPTSLQDAIQFYDAALGARGFTRVQERQEIVDDVGMLVFNEPTGTRKLYINILRWNQRMPGGSADSGGVAVSVQEE